MRLMVVSGSEGRAEVDLAVPFHRVSTRQATPTVPVPRKIGGIPASEPAQLGCYTYCRTSDATRTGARSIPKSRFLRDPSQALRRPSAADTSCPLPQRL
eukprot:221939-Rhodomonas_salina.4